MQDPSTKRASSIHGVSSRRNGRLRGAETFPAPIQEAAITIAATNAIDAFAAPHRGRLHSPARMACAFRRWREWRLRCCACHRPGTLHPSTLAPWQHKCVCISVGPFSFNVHVARFRKIRRAHTRVRMRHTMMCLLGPMYWLVLVNRLV